MSLLLAVSYQAFSGSAFYLLPGETGPFTMTDLTFSGECVKIAAVEI